MSNEKEVYEKLATLSERTEHIIGKIDDTKEHINKIFNKLDELPCGVMQERVKGLNGKIVWLWGVISFIGLSIILIALRALAR